MRLPYAPAPALHTVSPDLVQQDKKHAAEDKVRWSLCPVNARCFGVHAARSKQCSTRLPSLLNVAKVCRSSYLTHDLNVTRLLLTTQDPKQSKAAKSAAANLAAAEALELIDTKNVRAHTRSTHSLAASLVPFCKK
jgi:hypothetical protein